MALGSLAVTKDDGFYKGDRDWFHRSARPAPPRLPRRHCDAPLAVNRCV